MIESVYEREVFLSYLET